MVELTAPSTHKNELQEFTPSVTWDIRAPTRSGQHRRRQNKLYRSGHDDNDHPENVENQEQEFRWALLKMPGSTIKKYSKSATMQGSGHS